MNCNITLDKNIEGELGRYAEAWKNTGSEKGRRIIDAFVQVYIIDSMIMSNVTFDKYHEIYNNLKNKKPVSQVIKTQI